VTHYDVVVVGARVGGAATAALLARRGARVLVVDRAAYGSDTLSTHALMRAGVEQLQRWDVLDTIVDAGTPAIRAGVFHYDDATIPVPIKPAAGVDALYAPRRTLLDRVLVDAARDAGATVRFGVTVTDVCRDASGRVCGVDGRDGFRASAGLVVGADGLRSRIARAVDAPVIHAARHASAVVYGYARWWAGDAYEWYFRRGAAAGIIPTNDGEACVFASTSPERMRALAGAPRDTVRELLRRVAPELPELAPARLRSFSGQPGYLRQAHGPGWALVGDAGYFKDPISAHGITDALRDAELLARAVDGGGLEGYALERDRLSLPMLRVADAIAAYDWDAPTARSLLLEMSRATVDEVETLRALDGGGSDDAEVAA
jgi:flavin-dependent dehydrogenase